MKIFDVDNEAVKEKIKLVAGNYPHFMLENLGEVAMDDELRNSPYITRDGDGKYWLSACTLHRIEHEHEVVETPSLVQKLLRRQKTRYKYSFSYSATLPTAESDKALVRWIVHGRDNVGITLDKETLVFLQEDHTTTSKVLVILDPGQSIRAFMELVYNEIANYTMSWDGKNLKLDKVVSIKKRKNIGKINTVYE